MDSSLIDGHGGLEVEVMGMKAKNSENPAGFGQIAFDGFFQIRHLAFAPTINVFWLKQFHGYEELDRSDDGLRGQDGCHRFDDLGIVGIRRIVLQRDLFHLRRIARI